MKTAQNYLSSPKWVAAVVRVFGERTEAELLARAEEAARFANEEEAAEAEAFDFEHDARNQPYDFPLNMESEGH